MRRRHRILLNVTAGTSLMMSLGIALLWSRSRTGFVGERLPLGSWGIHSGWDGLSLYDERTRDRVFRVPHGVAYVATAAFPAVWFLPRRRPKTGICSQCGYDLRATPDRCPECGHVPT